MVVSAFEPVDLLAVDRDAPRQRAEGRCEVENQYTRVVRREGNGAARWPRSQRRWRRREDFEWRGLGVLPRSARRVRDGFAAFDAERLFARAGRPDRGSEGVPLRRGAHGGRSSRGNAAWFGSACTPERPLGTCMVSSEGACAAFFSYGRLRRPREEAPVGA